MIDTPDPPALSGLRFHRKLVVTDFSELWLAEDTKLERPVAVKVFAPQPDADGLLCTFPVAEWRRRFLVEARVMARLSHPNITPIHALEQLGDGRPAMVQQLMAGSLRLEIGRDHHRDGQAEQDRPRAVTPARASAILADTLAALAFIHGHGLVHRDVKPLNLLLAHGPGSRVKLADFGLVKRPGDEHGAAGTWVGTRAYMAPEQEVDADRVGPAADIWSLGVLAFRLLAGRLPEPGEALDRAVPDAPPPLAELAARARDPEPGRRPDAGTLAALVKSVLPGTG